MRGEVCHEGPRETGAATIGSPQSGGMMRSWVASVACQPRTSGELVGAPGVPQGAACMQGPFVRGRDGAGCGSEGAGG
jgi:hypothetical protein